MPSSDAARTATSRNWNLVELAAINTGATLRWPARRVASPPLPPRICTRTANGSSCEQAETASKSFRFWVESTVSPITCCRAATLDNARSRSFAEGCGEFLPHFGGDMDGVSKIEWNALT